MAHNLDPHHLKSRTVCANISTDFRQYVIDDPNSDGKTLDTNFVANIHRRSVVGDCDDGLRVERGQGRHRRHRDRWRTFRDAHSHGERRVRLREPKRSSRPDLP